MPAQSVELANYQEILDVFGRLDVIASEDQSQRRTDVLDAIKGYQIDRKDRVQVDVFRLLADV